MTRRPRYAPTLLLLVVPGVAQAVPSPTKVFATSFFSPADDTGADPPVFDPDPGLTGVLEIDLATGATTTFIPESAATGFQFPSDIALDEANNTLYVSTLTGFIFHFDATTGAPLPAVVPGPPGAFAALPLLEVQNGNGYNSLYLDEASGELVAATAFGFLTPYDTSTGAASANLNNTMLAFSSGLDRAPDGSYVVAIGVPPSGDGAIVSVDATGASTTLVDFGAADGVLAASNPAVVYADGDYDLDGDVDSDDLSVWGGLLGSDSLAADGNGDGVVDAVDYTIAREDFGEAARIIVADLNGNQLTDYALDGTDGGQLAIIPPDIPDPLPPTANPLAPSNSPSEILVTDQGTLLVSTLGLTRRPYNRGALLEFDRDGNLLQTIAADLPPLSGIAFGPRPISSSLSVPEPSASTLLIAGVVFASRRGNRG